jgi:hypothetical protein
MLSLNSEMAHTNCYSNITSESDSTKAVMRHIVLGLALQIASMSERLPVMNVPKRLI